MAKTASNIAPIDDVKTAGAGIEPAARAAIAEQLSGVLEDTYSLLIRTQIVHWNVRSRSFLSIHELTEKQYTALFAAIDVIAERVLALGFHVPSKQGSVLSPKGLSLDPKADADDMLEILAAENEACARTARDVAEAADEAGDLVTADMLTDRLAELEKAVWMLRAHKTQR